jgi:Pyruvate/2-oxoglutarate dehydrogenase complex, dihydrolipoamide acyltransferase (E2) component, and related enzymes
MPFILKMPKLSPTMEAGTIAKWHVKEGDEVDVDQLLMEVSTDKATVEYNAIDAGFIRKILIGEGVEVKVNQPIAILTETKEEDISGYKPEGLAVQTAVAAPKVEEFLKPEESVRGEKVFASPLARVMAKEKGIDLSQVSGSGPRGRVMSRDLVQVKRVGNAIREPLSPIRKVIAERLQYAKSTIPHFYVKEEVDATDLIAARHQLKEEGLPITLNDLIVKAAALTLKKHPEVNSGFDAAERAILRFQTIDISIAVDIPDGLITPIVMNADQKSVNEISQDIKGLVQKAKAGKLQPHEFQGGSFTVSNLGMFGTSEFSAIINPPQGAILAVGAALAKPRFINGQIEKRNILTLTLSVDHRVIDGAQAAKFLSSLKTILESPSILLI